jgi:CRISPR-associated protein Csm3
MANYQLTKKIIIRGVIEAKTGLAIGGSNTAIGIGGVDKGVIRNPVTNQPYIPGSSLKGKMRSLIELRDGTIGQEPMGAQVKNGASETQATASGRLFGNAAKRQEDLQRPSRIIVRDAYLIDEQVPKEGREDFFKNTDLPFTEVKTEVVIDRITSRAMPRQIERVPAGAKFNFELVVSIYNQDNETELMKNTFSALRLVENDYIGGHGSRGSGQVGFAITSVKERSTEYYKETMAENDVTDKFRPQFPQ